MSPTGETHPTDTDTPTGTQDTAGAAATPAATQEQIHAAISGLVKTFTLQHEGDDDEHLARALVMNAGRIAYRLRQAGLEVATKSNPTDLVTTADIGVENFIVGVLALLRPDDGIFGEEGDRTDGTSGRTWVIDPVDGTYNFAHGSDYFCTALALVEGDPEEVALCATEDAPSHIILGAVHRPMLGYTWLGGRDIPLTRDGEATAPLTDRPLGEVCLGTYMHPPLLRAGGDLPAAWGRMIAHAATIRLLGSASIDLASLTDGVLGAWAQHSVAAWDWLPGRALVEAAGGTCRTITAGGVDWCLAGTPSAVDDMQRHLQADS
ncbi:inositol monophosphatase [Corynebacterium sp. 13CS0277]|uniref:inositol monophosphatase family protein n=1 Tax=Corynebacterium sp. 13CS0277 TaxID=2071994 RepID=UPI000D032ECA|nr:inositol monophosphatase family protein [Corynebacterium sp. 13CS0277]PRQ11408.1 inositol monophosphatase [Corynebacterium sp. 13CS0277]